MNDDQVCVSLLCVYKCVCRCAGFLFTFLAHCVSLPYLFYHVDVVIGVVFSSFFFFFFLKCQQLFSFNMMHVQIPVTLIVEMFFYLSGERTKKICVFHYRCCPVVNQKRFDKNTHIHFRCSSVFVKL